MRSVTWPFAARPRSASRPRTGSRSRPSCGRGSRRGRARCSRASRPTAVNLAWALDRDARRADPGARRARCTTRRSSAAGDGRPRCRALRPGTRALTHCNAGGLATGGYGTRGRRAARGVGARPARACARRRDAAASPGRPADGLGARGGRDPARRDRRLRRRVVDGRAARSTASSPAPTASLRTATRRTRSARTPSPCSRRTTASRSTSSRRPRRSTWRLRPAQGIPIEERDAGGDHDPLPGAEPRLRRDAGRADRGDRHRGRRAPRALRGVAGRRCA